MKKRNKNRNRLNSEKISGKKQNSKAVGVHAVDEPAIGSYLKYINLALCLLLVLSALAVYSPLLNSEFVAYDDDQYVYKNEMVKNGLTLPAVKWAFGTFYYANWHPLTWLSHMMDCQWFGLNAGMHHGMNVLFHMVNIFLLFAVFLKITHRPWRSFFVAGIFALHPLHVESVAWISERKDVLSTMFGLLSLYLYTHYTEKPAKLNYGLMFFSFALSLMAKPMLVTLPFLFLLLDVWPFKRLQASSTKKMWPVVIEKIPLFALATVSSILTYAAQRGYGAVIALANLPLSQRLGNAVISYCLYLSKAFWPSRLAVLYPIQVPTAFSVIVATLILLAITIAAVLHFKKRPYILIGWLWFLGMLVPTIGIVQVGAQSMADRYTYIPLVGISLALVWFIADIGKKFPNRKIIMPAIGCALFLCLGLLTMRQTAYWKSSQSLFEHALAVTDRNFTMHNNLGSILESKGSIDEAMAHYREAVSINNNFAEAHANLGFNLMREEKYDEAGKHLSDAVRLNPKAPKAQGDFGTLLTLQGKFAESIPHFEKCLETVPNYAEIHCNLCYALLQEKRTDEALVHCTKALQLNPGFIDARYNLGTVFVAMGKNAEAREEFLKVLANNPNFTPAKNALDKLPKIP